MHIQDSGDSDLLERCTFEVRALDGRALGTGVLIDPIGVLTCAHVVGSETRVELVGWSGESYGGEVRETGFVDGPDDLAWIELEERQPDSWVLGLEDGQRLDEFSTIGHPARGRQTAWGKILGRSSTYRGWLELQINGRRKIVKGYSGGAVWNPKSQKAVGLVVRSKQNEEAFAITHGQIQDFLARVWQRRVAGIELEVEATDDTLPNLEIHRLVRVLDPRTDQVLGHGFCLRSGRFLTALEVARSADSLSIAAAEGARFGRSETAEVLWPIEGSKEEDFGLALLATSRTRRPVPAKRWSKKSPPPRSRWRALGFRLGASSSSRWAYGGQTPSEPAESPARWALRVPEAGVEARGAAVFLETSADSWGLWGVLGPRGREGAVLEIRPLPGLTSAAGFLEALGSLAPSERWDRTLSRIAAKLRNRDLSRALTEVEPDWSHHPETEDGRNDLARELCFDTLPEALARKAYEAIGFCETTQSSAASEVFELLMDTLPAAIESQWPLELPDAFASEVRIEVVSRLLVEFALAAAAGTSADFFSEPERTDTSLPGARHEIPGPRKLEEVWDEELDPETATLAGDVTRVLLQFPDSSEGWESHAKFLGRLASLHYQAKDGRLIERRKVDDLGRIQDPGERARSLIADLNRRIGRTTLHGRRLYMVSEPERVADYQQLATHLPELQIVHRVAQDEEFDEVTDYLERIFHQMRKHREAAP